MPEPHPINLPKTHTHHAKARADLSVSRERRASGATGKPGRMNGKCAPIVAVEGDDDVSRHRRLDEGIIAASNEARNPVLQRNDGGGKVSWWTSGIVGWGSPASSTANTGGGNLTQPQPSAQIAKPVGPIPPGATNLQHRRTTSKQTYKIP